MRGLRNHGRALLLLLRVERGLRRGTLPTLADDLGITLDLDSSSEPDPVPAVLPASTQITVRAAERVLRRWPFGDTCLRRCLVLGVVLADLHPVLRIGVKSDGAGFAAHSWLEVDGHPTEPVTGTFHSLGR